MSNWKWLTPEVVQSFCVGIITIISAIGWAGNFIKQHKEKQKKDTQSVSKTIERQCLIDENILDKMEEIKEYYNADRVHFYDFHNGTHYSNGRSAKKLSCTYEKVRFGVEPIKRIMKDIETSDVPVFLNRLFTECKFYIKNVEDLREENDIMYIYMKRSGIKSFYVIAIKNQNHEPIGFIMLQYLTNKVPEIDKNSEFLQRFRWFMEEQLKQML